MGALPTPLDKRNSWLTRGQHPNKQGQKAGNREVCLRGRGQGSSVEPWSKGRDRKTSEKEAVGGGTQLGLLPYKTKWYVSPPPPFSRSCFSVQLLAFPPG